MPNQHYFLKLFCHVFDSLSTVHRTSIAGRLFVVGLSDSSLDSQIRRWTLGRHVAGLLKSSLDSRRRRWTLGILAGRLLDPQNRLAGRSESHQDLRDRLRTFGASLGSRNSLWIHGGHP
ncbi:hypothetical protein PSTT_15740 [Puccinia striiformis]|uniref:Uncharacterized protein n=1 Tax=Puccinia striiformis TaxID=27350 RepID=A0A2S4UGK7_9BASI|nr:hypothetical protein PSTT_15740 [Puccinia striiformis]